MFIRILFIAIATVLLASCSNRVVLPMVVIDQVTCQQIELAVNQELIINLPSNPTTGYRWSIAKQPDFLKVIEADNYQQDTKIDKKMLGVGGQSLWIFKAEQVGIGELNLIYHRPWEKTEAPAEQFICKVTVR